MHPREHELSGDADERIARALRRLPEPGELPRDGWERLQGRMRQPTPWRGWVPTAAVAASALVVALGLMLRTATGPERVEPGGLQSSSATPLDVDDGAPRSVAEWRARSAELERLLADLPEPSMLRASTGTTTALLEDRIAMIDDELSELPRDERAGRVPAADADALWRERTLLLDSLVRVRYAAVVDPGT